MTTTTQSTFLTEAQREVLATYFESIPDTFIDGVYFTAHTDKCIACVITVQKDSGNGKWYRYVDQIDPEGRTTTSNDELAPGAFGLA